MFPAYTDQVIVSDLPDIGELPLDAEVNVDDAEYARIIRRLITLDGEPHSPVSAFNSSI
jgi:FXSXX-COOH protein